MVFLLTILFYWQKYLSPSGIPDNFDISALSHVWKNSSGQASKLLVALTSRNSEKQFVIFFPVLREMYNLLLRCYSPRIYQNRFVFPCYPFNLKAYFFIGDSFTNFILNFFPWFIVFYTTFFIFLVATLHQFIVGLVFAGFFWLCIIFKTWEGI